MFLCPTHNNRGNISTPLIRSLSNPLDSLRYFDHPVDRGLGSKMVVLHNGQNLIVGVSSLTDTVASSNVLHLWRRYTQDLGLKDFPHGNSMMKHPDLISTGSRKLKFRTNEFTYFKVCYTRKRFSFLTFLTSYNLDSKIPVSTLLFVVMSIKSVCLFFFSEQTRVGETQNGHSHISLFCVKFLYRRVKSVRIFLLPLRLLQ